jgi:hypothetical protein
MWNARSPAAFALACVVAMPALANAQEDGPAQDPAEDAFLFGLESRAYNGSSGAGGNGEDPGRDVPVHGGLLLP